MAEIEVKSTIADKYPNASKKAAEEKKDIPAEKPKSVVKKPAKKKKRSFLAKATDEIVEDTAPSVWNYILHDIIIPTVKDLMYDTVAGGIERILYGSETSTRSRSRKRKNGGTYIPYNSLVDGRKRSREDDERYRKRARFRSEDYALEYREDAEAVLNELYDRIEAYDSVSVADFLDLMEITSDYTDQNYGWTNLSGVGISRTRDGYVIKLPSPRSIV